MENGLRGLVATSVLTESDTEIFFALYTFECGGKISLLKQLAKCVI